MARLLVIVLLGAAWPARGAVPVYRGDAPDVALDLGLLLDVLAVPWLGEDADPYNLDPLFSEGLRLHRLDLRWTGRLPHDVSVHIRTGQHGHGVEVLEAEVAVALHELLSLTAGRFHNPTLALLRRHDEALALPFRPLALRSSHPGHVTGLLASGGRPRLASWWLTFCPTDTRFSERTVGAAVALHPLGPVARRASGFLPDEAGYEDLRLAVGAGVLDTTYAELDDSYTRWGLDLVAHWRGLSLLAGLSRYRANAEASSCGRSTWVTRINQGVWVQAGAFVLPGRLSLHCRWEWDEVGAPLTDWAAGEETVVTCAGTWHVVRDRLALRAGYSHRRDDEGLDNDHLFVDVQVEL